MALQPATNRQVPDHAILDRYNKQAYLGNRYSFILPVTAGGTTEVAQIILSNPLLATTSFQNQVGLFVDLRRLVSSNVTAASNVMRMYLNPTVTSVGTPQTPQNMRPASPNVSASSLHSAPTISANGTLVEALSSGAFGTVQSEAIFIVDPGQTLLITVQTANGGIVVPAISWNEI